MPNAPKATPAVTAVALHTGGGPWFKAIMIVASTTTPSHDTTVLKPMDAVSALRTSTFDNAKAVPEERAGTTGCPILGRAARPPLMRAVAPRDSRSGHALQRIVPTAMIAEHGAVRQKQQTQSPP